MTKKDIVKEYKKEKNITKTAQKAKISPSKVKKILITEGVYECPLSKKIAEMRLEGLSKKIICKRLNISPNLYSANSPYEKVEYNSTTPSHNALKIRRHRKNKNKEETRMISLEKVQNNLEKLIGKEYTSLDWSENIYDDIVIAWGDYEFKGENQVIVSDDNSPGFLSTYINDADSPMFILYTDNDIYLNEESGEYEETITITEVERDSRW